MEYFFEQNKFVCNLLSFPETCFITFSLACITLYEMTTDVICWYCIYFSALKTAVLDLSIQQTTPSLIRPVLQTVLQSLHFQSFHVRLLWCFRNMSLDVVMVRHSAYLVDPFITLLVSIFDFD